MVAITPPRSAVAVQQPLLDVGEQELPVADGTLHIDGWADDAHLAGMPPQPSTKAGER